jgi:molybdopterin converting factor small subunit
MIHIELYGVPRLRAGTARLAVEGARLGEAIDALMHNCPALGESLRVGGVLNPAYRLSLNGERFVADDDTPLADGDVLLLLSADVGG